MMGPDDMIGTIARALEPDWAGGDRYLARRVILALKESGYCVVPRVPTQDMISAGIIERHEQPTPEAWSLATSNIYRSMIDAAPDHIMPPIQEPGPLEAATAAFMIPRALHDALGNLVSHCADHKDIYPDAQTALEVITDAVNLLYACVEDGVFGPLESGEGE